MNAYYEQAKTAGVWDATKRYLGHVTDLGDGITGYTGDLQGLQHGPARGSARVLQGLFSSKDFHPNPGARSGLGSALYTVKELGRDYVLGNPIDIVHNIRTQGLGEQYKKYYMPWRGWKGQPLGGKILSGLTTAAVAMPIVSSAHAAVTDKDHRGEHIGAGMTSALAAPFLGQLGMAGGALAPKINRLGGRIGRLFDRTPPTAPPAVSAMYDTGRKLVTPNSASEQLWYHPGIPHPVPTDLDGINQALSAYGSAPALP